MAADLAHTSGILDAIFSRRAVKVFDDMPVSAADRDKIIEAACVAPSSFNSQPWRFCWVESQVSREEAARLCMGQSPAATAPALVVAIADLGSWRATVQAQLAWMRHSGFSEEKVTAYEKRAKLAKWFYRQGWFGILGAFKWLALRFLNLWKVIGMAPVSSDGLFCWATKNTSLACANLMIAAEALGLNTCPMEGFDGRRLSRFLGLSPKYQRIVMVIAVGHKSGECADQPQWRRPVSDTVRIL